MLGRGANRSRRWSRRPEARGTLAFMRPGDTAVISDISDDGARAQAIRFGMGAGASVSCVTTLPGGPVIVRSGRQEIAVGRALARRISVGESCEASHACS
jgi:Fe2+ transport system protein FeoA